MLFLLAGVLIAFDLWRLRTRLPSRLARAGAAVTSVAALLTGVGFAIGSFAGFLLAYAGELFAIPLGSPSSASDSGGAVAFRAGHHGFRSCSPEQD